MLCEHAKTGVPPYVFALRTATGQIVEGRNQIMESFLATDAEWLFMVDADMGFGPDTITDLIGDGTDPIVGALCFGLKRQGDDDPVTMAVNLRCFPTIYTFHELDDKVGFKVITDYPRNARTTVAATGAACFVIRRDAAEKIRDQYGTWFDQIVHPKGPTKFSEDMSFFIRAAGADLPVTVDTSVLTSHDKGGIFYTQDVWDRQQRA